MTQESIESNPLDWGLSTQAALLLSKEPEILMDLAHDRLLPPFPPGYVPTVVEVLFDDVPFLRSKHGILIYARECNPDYHPLFIEYRFDDEIAMFHVNGEYVVNRVEGIAQVAALQGFLDEGEAEQWY
jgi:hypothetical protein